MMNIFLILVISLFSVPALAKTKELTESHICRAAISTIFDKKIETVEVFRQQKNIVYVSFTPEEGDKTTRFKCLLNGFAIVWATETGSYRNTDIDSDIAYETKDNVLFIRENHKNGSVFTKSFDIKKLIAEK